MPNGAREAIELLAEQNRQMINWSHLHDLVLQLQVKCVLSFIIIRRPLLFLFLCFFFVFFFFLSLFVLFSSVVILQ